MSVKKKSTTKKNTMLKDNLNREENVPSSSNAHLSQSSTFSLVLVSCVALVALVSLVALVAEPTHEVAENTLVPVLDDEGNQIGYSVGYDVDPSRSQKGVIVIRSATPLESGSDEENLVGDARHLPKFIRK